LRISILRLRRLPPFLAMRRSVAPHAADADSLAVTADPLADVNGLKWLLVDINGGHVACPNLDYRLHEISNALIYR
jgi:hypothetical protein